MTTTTKKKKPFKNIWYFWNNTETVMGKIRTFFILFTHTLFNFFMKFELHTGGEQSLLSKWLVSLKADASLVILSAEESNMLVKMKLCFWTGEWWLTLLGACSISIPSVLLTNEIWILDQRVSAQLKHIIFQAPLELGACVGCACYTILVNEKWKEI